MLTGVVKRTSDSPVGLTRHRRRHSQLRGSGVAYIITTLFIAIGAFNSQNNLLFWAFGIAIAGLAISGVVSGSPLVHIELARDPIRPAQVNGQLHFGYQLRHSGRWLTAYAVHVEELEATRSKQPWLRSDGVGVPQFGPRTQTHIHSTGVPVRRGVHQLNTVRVSTIFPFGFLRKSVYFDLPAQVVVWPSIRPLKESVLAAACPGFDPANRSRNRIGPGDEFFSLREYQHGDPIRTIAWRASARGEEVLVRQNVLPAPPKILIHLQDPPPNLSPEIFENTLSLVASLLSHLADEGFAFGLRADWAGVLIEPAQGPSALERLLDVLAALDLDSNHAPTRNDHSADILISFADSNRTGVIYGGDPQVWAADADSELIREPGVNRRLAIRSLPSSMRKLVGRQGASS